MNATKIIDHIMVDVDIKIYGPMKLYCGSENIKGIELMLRIDFIFNDERNISLCQEKVNNYILPITKAIDADITYISYYEQNRDKHPVKCGHWDICEDTGSHKLAWYPSWNKV